MTNIPPPPPIPLTLRRALKGFTVDQVRDARNTLATLAKSCTDYKTRKEAAEYIDKMARADDAELFSGDPDALAQLTALPLEQQTAAAMQLYAKQLITRPDLDMILKAVQADQSAKLLDMERARIALERENKDLTHQLLGGRRIEGHTVEAETVQ